MTCWTSSSLFPSRWNGPVLAGVFVAALLVPAVGLAQALWIISRIATVEASVKAETLGNGIAQAMNCGVLGFGIVLLFIIGILAGKTARRIAEKSKQNERA